MSRRLLFVHAHPDDESSKGAATAARYVDAGAEVVLVTCTDGAAGELLNPGLDPVVRAEAEHDLAAVRRRELARAVEAIGFTRVHALGFADSGYHLDPADVPEGTFARTPLDLAAHRLAAVITEERPHVIVTYPEDGGYPHPDHIMTHLVTMRALDLVTAWRVAKVYAVTGFPAERLLALDAAMVERGLASPFAEWIAAGLPDRPAPHARVPVSEHLVRRDAALRAHATQVDPAGDWFAVPAAVEAAAYPYEAFELLASVVWAVPPEEDLFAGLDVDAWDAAHGVTR